MRAAKGPAPFLFPEGARFGDDNVMLHARARRHQVDDFAGPLSIKTVVRGEVSWRVKGQDLPVDAASFLVLADGEPYAMDLDAPKPVETACAFFRRGLVEEMASDLTTPLGASLENPGRGGSSLPWISRLHFDPQRQVSGQVETLAARCSRQFLPSGVEEDFLLLAERVLLLYEEMCVRVRQLPAVKAATREELFRRVERGREFLHSGGEEPLSLESAARHACLSRYHFHRAFRRAFDRTPHQYLTELRMARAKAMLEQGAWVTEVCVAVGMSSVSSFSQLFRAHQGVSPSRLRRK
jgi:AraC-like DNA-binding protein